MVDERAGGLVGAWIWNFKSVREERKQSAASVGPRRRWAGGRGWDGVFMRSGAGERTGWWWGGQRREEEANRLRAERTVIQGYWRLEGEEGPGWDGRPVRIH